MLLPEVSPAQMNAGCHCACRVEGAIDTGEDYMFCTSLQPLFYPQMYLIPLLYALWGAYKLKANYAT